MGGARVPRIGRVLTRAGWPQNGCTPLHVASFSGSETVGLLLLEAGALQNAKNKVMVVVGWGGFLWRTQDACCLWASQKFLGQRAEVGPIECPIKSDVNRSSRVAWFMFQIAKCEFTPRGTVGEGGVLRRGQGLTREFGAAE